jgi:branched-chain amino acid transport system substrate-binding protein
MRKPSFFAPPASRLTSLLLVGTFLLAACAPAAAPSPTAAPAKPAESKPAVAKPTEAARPAAPPAAAPAASPTTAAPAKAAAPTGRPIVVGGTLPLSGPFAGEASAFQKLAETWAEMVNESGGLKVGGENRPIRFIIYDDSSEQPKAVQLYEKLVGEDKVDLLIGPYSSPMTFAASTVADKHQIPMLMVEANSDAIYTRGYKWIVGVLDTGRNWSNQGFDMLKAEDKVKTIGIVTQDNLHTKETRESSVNNARRVGIEVSLDETLPSTTQDFSPVIAKLKSANPDLVYVNAFENFAVPFVKQAKELGLRPKGLHVTHHGGYLLDAVGRDAEQISGEHYWLPGIPGEGIQEFEALQKRADVAVDKWPWAAIRFPAYQVLRATIEQAGSTDRARLMDAFKSVEVNTLGGKIKFDADGRGTMNPYPSQIQEGKYVLLWPREYTRATWIYPRTAW